MDLVHEGVPWTRSKEGVHGPGVHVLSSPVSDWTLSQSFVCYVEEHFGNSDDFNFCAVTMLVISL